MTREEQFESFDAYRNAMSTAVGILVKRVPALSERCIFHGTASASITGLGHRESWDADFMTAKWMDDTADIAALMKKAFKDSLTWTQRDEESHMFQGVVALPGLPALSFDLFRNVHDALPVDASRRQHLGNMATATHKMYAAEKVASMLERSEVKDLYDLLACFRQPHLQADIKRTIAREGLRGIKRLQSRMEACKDMIDDFGPKSASGYLPVTLAGTGAQFSEYLAERRKCYELVAERRRADIDI